jgi:hypothetical protein
MYADNNAMLIDVFREKIYLKLKKKKRKIIDFVCPFNEKKKENTPYLWFCLFIYFILFYIFCLWFGPIIFVSDSKLEEERRYTIIYRFQ